MTRHCPSDYLICGIRSIHDNKKEDRLYEFYCCNYSGMHTTDQMSSEGGGVDDIYTNHWRRDLMHTSWPRFFTGMQSYHSNSKEDRAFLYYSKRISNLFLLMNLFEEVLVSKIII